MEHGAWSREHGAWSMESMEHGAGAWGVGRGAWGAGPFLSSGSKSKQITSLRDPLSKYFKTLNTTLLNAQRGRRGEGKTKRGIQYLKLKI